MALGLGFFEFDDAPVGFGGFLLGFFFGFGFFFCGASSGGDFFLDGAIECFEGEVDGFVAAHIAIGDAELRSSAGELLAGDGGGAAARDFFEEGLGDGA